MNFPRTDSYLIVQTFETFQIFCYDENVPEIITEIFGTYVNQTLLHNYLKKPSQDIMYVPKIYTHFLEHYEYV